MTDNELLVKVLISTVSDTSWDDGHLGDTDGEPAYICDFNASELSKKLYNEMPELYENQGGNAK